MPNILFNSQINERTSKMLQPIQRRVWRAHLGNQECWQRWHIEAKLVSIHIAIANSSPLNTIRIAMDTKHLHQYQFSFY